MNIGHSTRKKKNDEGEPILFYYLICYPCSPQDIVEKRDIVYKELITHKFKTFLYYTAKKHKTRK